MTLPDALDPAAVVGFGTDGDGAGLHLRAIAYDASSLSITASHFSAIGVLEAAGCWEAPAGQSPDHSYEQRIACLMKNVGGDLSELESTDVNLIASSMKEWFEDWIAPNLDAAVQCASELGGVPCQRLVDPGSRSFTVWRALLQFLHDYGLPDIDLSDLEEAGWAKIDAMIGAEVARLDRACIAIDTLDAGGKKAMLKVMLNLIITAELRGRSDRDDGQALKIDSNTCGEAVVTLVSEVTLEPDPLDLQVHTSEGASVAVNVIDRTPVADLSPLVGLTALTLLDASSTAVRDLSPLSNLTGLTRLHLFGVADQGQRDLSRLAALVNLEYLQIGGGSGPLLLGLEGVEGMTALERLDVVGNRITDASPLSGLSNLRYADLRLNYGITDISPLALGTFPSSGATLHLGYNYLAEFFEVPQEPFFKPGQYPLVVERCGEDVADGPALRALIARGATLTVNPQHRITCRITDLESGIPDLRTVSSTQVDIYTDLFPCAVCGVPLPDGN